MIPGIYLLPCISSGCPKLVASISSGFSKLPPCSLPPFAFVVDFQLRNEDLGIDTYRSGGSGGQHANTTNSAVQINHIPRAMTVSIQDEQSQHMNKAKALKVLRAKLYEMERLRIQMSRSKLRSKQIGSGDRLESI